MPKLSNEESSKLDIKITLIELYTQIFSTKNNKNPSPEGFTNEFSKIFWDELKYLLLELMNYFRDRAYKPKLFIKKQLHAFQREIKLEINWIKNWRPITLLNSLYKFY